MSESSSETEPTERARATWEAVAPGWEAARARSVGSVSEEDSDTRKP